MSACYTGEIMYIIYTNDYILAGKDEEELRHIVFDIKQVGLDITEEVDTEESQHKKGGQVYISSVTATTIQPNILKLGLSKSDSNPRTTPALTINILGTCQDSENIRSKISP